VDERAVLAALNDGRLAGLATDVFGEEPPGCTALVGHDRVIATPHVGGYTAQSVDRAVTVAVGMMLECLGR
jgi:D-3-phosphoglycerate dehydrogenase